MANFYRGIKYNPSEKSSNAKKKAQGGIYRGVAHGTIQEAKPEMQSGTYRGIKWVA
tara:strand:+ start:3221 stop:3388 length:168 start_codon:yes stop_codon:yes gene_type:complete